MKYARRSIVVAMYMSASIACAPAAIAAPSDVSTIDDQLLQESASDAVVSKAAAAASSNTQLGQPPRSVIRAPDPDGPPTQAWQTIAKAMAASSARIAAYDSGHKTQIEQQQIVAQLDALLAAMNSGSPPQKPEGAGRTPGEKSGGTSTGMGDGNAGAEKQPQNSVERHGSAVVEKPTTEKRARGAAEEFWGTLPPHERARVLQNASGRVPPQYQAAVEEYFQRLLENKQ